MILFGSIDAIWTGAKLNEGIFDPALGIELAAIIEYGFVCVGEMAPCEIGIVLV